MKIGCKILHVEDLSADAELIGRELKKSGVLCDITVVNSKEEYERALDSIRFDLVLCDHLVPGFNSYKALSILKEKKLNIPFIIVTASMTEDVAMALVRDGADDYIIKDRLKRLPLAVENAVEKFRHEKDRKRLVDNLYDTETLAKESLTQLSTKILLATKVAGIGIWEFLFDEKKLLVNEVLLLQFDTTPASFDGDHTTLLRAVIPEDRELLVSSIRMHISSGTEFTLEYRIIWPDGSLHYMKTSGVVELNTFGDPYRIIGSNQDITADKLAEQKLKESEARMAQAQLMAKVGSWETDLLTMDVLWSVETCRIFDITDCRENTTHEKFLEFVHPEDKNLVDEAFRNSIGKTNDSSIEHRIITAKGDLKFVEECWRFIYSDKGEPIKAVGTIQDISVSKKASLLLMESEAKYRSLIESSMDAILLASGTGEILAANLSACILFKMTEKELLASKREMIVASNDPRFKSFMKERILTGSARGEHTFIRKDKSEFPGEVSSVVFLNADGEERISVTIRDVTNRKKAENELLEKSNELKEALNGLNKTMDSSVDVICAVDAKGYFIKVSAASESIWGYKPSEMIGRPILDFVYNEDISLTQVTANKVMGGETISHFENRYVRKDGRVVPMEWTARWDDVDQVRYGVARDITAKKRLEKAFEIERKRFENLYLQAPSCMGILKGPEHIFELANPLYLQLIGRSDVIGKKLIDVLPELKGQGVLEYLAGVYNTGETFTINESLIQFDSKGTGELVDTYLNFIHQAHRNVDGEIDGIFFFGIDVTEQVISRKKIDESQKQYRQIVQTAQEGIWLVDDNDVTTFVNDKLCEMFEYSREEMMGKDMYYFMDEEGKKIALELMIRKRAGDSGQLYHKYISKTNKEVWTQISANPLFDDEGVYIGALAMITDITEFKKAQDLIQASEERYRTLFAQNLAGFYQSTLGGKILNCNDAFAKMLKYDSAEDIMSVNASEFYFTEMDRNVFIKRVVDNQSLHNYEGVAKCKDGSALYFLENVSVHLNKESGVEYFDGIMIDITDKKAAEDSLEKAFNEKNTILESIGDAFFAVDTNWTVTYWNSQAESFLHINKEDIVGKNLWQVFASGVDMLSYSKYQEAIATQQITLFEDYYEVLDKWFEISAYPSENGLSVYFKDITDRKRTDKAIRASEEVRKLITDAAMDAIVCFNSEGCITVWNPQAEKIFGWKEEETLGRPLSETIMPQRYRERHKQGMIRYLQTGNGPMLRRPFEMEAVNSAGQEFPIELSIVPIKQDDTEFFCAFIRDISSRKHSEEKMSELHVNLLEQSKKLMISNEELEKYAYVTSHDLQEPLRMVTSFLQLLQKKYESQLDDTAQKYINFAVDGADRMKTLILDLLEFSRISSVKTEHETVSLDSIVSKTLISLKSAIDETQAIVLASSLPDIPGNEFQLLQLFQNLISNAIKYKGEDNPVIELGYKEGESDWEFYVKDNGIGIDPKFSDKIFVIFQRLHNKKNYKGTGIGLAICKKIVELHNGRIWVEANGTGSTFYFTLAKMLPEKKSFSNLN